MSRVKISRDGVIIAKPGGSVSDPIGDLYWTSRFPMLRVSERGVAPIAPLRAGSPMYSGTANFGKLYTRHPIVFAYSNYPSNAYKEMPCDVNFGGHPLYPGYLSAVPNLSWSYNKYSVTFTLLRWSNGSNQLRKTIASVGFVVMENTVE